MTGTPSHGPTWRRGFFTDRAHAVTAPADRMTFHGLTIAWSICGRPTVDGPNPPHTYLSPCARCLYLTREPTGWNATGPSGDWPPECPRA